MASVPSQAGDELTDLENRQEPRLVRALEMVAPGTALREGLDNILNARTGALLWKLPLGGQVNSGPMSYSANGRQYVAVLSGVGGWAGIGLAAGLTDPTAGLGAVGGYAALSNYTALGGTLTVFALPQ